MRDSRLISDPAEISPRFDPSAAARFSISLVIFWKFPHLDLIIAKTTTAPIIRKIITIPAPAPPGFATAVPAANPAEVLPKLEEDRLEEEELLELEEVPPCPPPALAKTAHGEASTSARARTL